MTQQLYPPCPHCGSNNVLPFEDDETATPDPTLFIIIVMAFGLVIGYFLFVISTYLTFPLIVFVAIIISTKLINKNDKKKKVVHYTEKDYMCLDCSGFFKT